MRHVYARAVIKLSLLYGAILATVALFFSLNWYLAATGEIERALDRQTRQLRGRNLVSPVYEDIRTEQLQDAKKAITVRLVITNVIVITIGGLGSYALARRTLKPIKKSYDAQERFTSDASHELRTPLTSMISQTEVTLCDKKVSKGELLEVLSSNLDDAAGMSAMVENLLILSRQEKLASSDYQKIAAVEIINRAKKNVRVPIKKNMITIKENLSSDVTVLTHPEAMERIMTILLDNAIKYSPQKSVINLKVYTERNHVIIEVKDSGVGMTSSELDHIFERFYQVDASRSQTHGYGLGLPLAERLAKMCGAKITVKSKPAHGSTFSVMIPLA